MHFSLSSWVTRHLKLWPFSCLLLAAFFRFWYFVCLFLLRSEYLSASCEPDILLSTLNPLSRVILTPSSWGKYYSRSHASAEETEGAGGGRTWTTLNSGVLASESSPALCPDRGCYSQFSLEMSLVLVQSYACILGFLCWVLSLVWFHQVYIFEKSFFVLVWWSPSLTQL